MIEVLLVLIALLLLVTLLFEGAIFYMIQKGLKEIIKGMNSLDERLNQIEVNIRSKGDPKE